MGHTEWCLGHTGCCLGYLRFFLGHIGCCLGHTGCCLDHTRWCPGHTGCCLGHTGCSLDHSEWCLDDTEWTQLAWWRLIWPDVWLGGRMAGWPTGGGAAQAEVTWSGRGDIPLQGRPWRTHGGGTIKQPCWLTFTILLKCMTRSIEGVCCCKIVGL